MRLFVSLVLSAFLGFPACGDDAAPSPSPEPDAASDAGPDGAGDSGDAGDAGVEPDSGPSEGGGEPEPAPLPPLPTKSPLAKPVDVLAGTGVTSCAVYLEETCDGGTLRRCEIYDGAGGAWVDEPDPLLERAYLFDRWRDLYNSPDGQAIDRDFVGETLPGTPESVWGDPAHFAGYFGVGDGGIWTGWSVVASILRYARTGTAADYARMEEHVRAMLTMYEVTGIPGYMTRNHYLLLPADGPNTPDHILRWEGSYTPNHHHRPSPDPGSVPDLPEAYLEGIPDGRGGLVKGEVMWHGRPSIDQNTGPMVSLPMAWDLLEDEGVRDRIVHNLTCYLHRLQRIEIVNLQQNTELLEGLIAYFSVGELLLDPDDVDLTKTDRIVGYVHRQINTLNEDGFDTSCPDGPQLEPWRVIDATSDEFVLDLLALVQDMNVSDERENTIDHYYFPTIRGGDAMHLMHLATMAWHFTGDDRYRRFLFDTLIGEEDAVGVLHTAGAFGLPKFCKKYYGDQITFGPWWAFLELLDEGDLKAELQRGFFVEMYEKLVKVARNADFNIMLAGTVPDSLGGVDVSAEKAAALQIALEDLAWMGGNGGAIMGDPGDPAWLDDPRRTYSLPKDTVVAHAGEGDDSNQAVCPTEAEEAICSAKVEILGIDLGDVTDWDTQPCTGDAWECPVGDPEANLCTWKQMSHALPLPVRPHTDYLWQRNPFAIGRSVSPEGHRQFAGSDYSVPYWNARRYGFLTEGQGQALAWRDVGACGE